MEYIKEGLEFFEHVINDKQATEFQKFHFLKQNLKALDLSRIRMYDSKTAENISKCIQDVHNTTDYNYGVLMFMQIYKALKDLDFKLSPNNIDRQTHYSYFKNVETNFSIHHKKYSKESKRIGNLELTEHAILGLSNIDSENLHKFETKINGHPIFRSGIGVHGNDKDHVLVYTLLKRKESHVVVFLRCLKHKDWQSLLNSGIRRKLLGKQINDMKKEFGLD